MARCPVGGWQYFFLQFFKKDPFVFRFFVFVSLCVCMCVSSMPINCLAGAGNRTPVLCKVKLLLYFCAYKQFGYEHGWIYKLSLWDLTCLFIHSFIHSFIESESHYIVAVWQNPSWGDAALNIYPPQIGNLWQTNLEIQLGDHMSFMGVTYRSRSDSKTAASPRPTSAPPLSQSWEPQNTPYSMQVAWPLGSQPFLLSLAYWLCFRDFLELFWVVFLPA